MFARLFAKKKNLYARSYAAVVKLVRVNQEIREVGVAAPMLLVRAILNRHTTRKCRLNQDKPGEI